MRTTDILTPQDVHTFCNLVRMPEAATACWDRFYTPEEIAFVLARADTLQAGGLVEAELDLETRQALEKMVRRGVLDRQASGRVQTAPFAVRFELWALFEDRSHIPDRVYQALLEQERTRYEQNQEALIQSLQRGVDPDPSRVRPYYVLHQEALALLERVPRIFLWPCNCRVMTENCSQPVLTCLRFDNDRGLGRELSKERAREVAREAIDQGLMHSAEIGLQEDGSIHGALCNCCPDCCFPHLAADRYGARGLFPLSRYVAGFWPHLCTGCRQCVRVCPFQALEKRYPGRDRSQPRVSLVVERCRGCGVCAWHCPTGALSMCLKGGKELLPPEVAALFRPGAKRMISR